MAFGREGSSPSPGTTFIDDKLVYHNETTRKINQTSNVRTIVKFQVIYTYDPDYQGYVAEVPDLPGCLSQGKTIEEAAENIRDAIKGVLLVMEQNGEPYSPAAT